MYLGSLIRRKNLENLDKRSGKMISPYIYNNLDEFKEICCKHCDITLYINSNDSMRCVCKLADEEAWFPQPCQLAHWQRCKFNKEAVKK